MDYAELKKYLMDQTLPMSEAVRRKIKYLESDDIFAKPDPNYVFLFSLLRENRRIKSENEDNQRSHIVNQPENMVENGDWHKEPVENKTDSRSMADKIAALRGILNVSQGYTKYKK